MYNNIAKWCKYKNDKSIKNVLEKAVRITSGLGPEDGEDDQEEESEEEKSGGRENLSFAGTAFERGRLRQQDHADADGSVQHHDEVCLEDELTLKKNCFRNVKNWNVEKILQGKLLNVITLRPRSFDYIIRIIA